MDITKRTGQMRFKNQLIMEINSHTHGRQIDIQKTDMQICHRYFRGIKINLALEFDAIANHRSTKMTSRNVQYHIIIRVDIGQQICF